MKKTITLALIFGFTLNALAQKPDSTKTPSITLRGVSASGTEPLIVIDGNKQYVRGTSSVNGIDPGNVESITVLRDSSAISKYGADGFAGVVEIKTKNGLVTPLTSTIIPKKLPDSILKGKISGLSFRSITPLNTEPSKLRNLLLNDFDPKAKPLFVVDGKEVTEIRGLNPDSIKAIDVLKGAEANKLYGTKAKNGVLIITTKKATTLPKQE